MGRSSKYTPEFREEAVRLHREQADSSSPTARSGRPQRTSDASTELTQRRAPRDEQVRELRSRASSLSDRTPLRLHAYYTGAAGW